MRIYLSGGFRSGWQKTVKNTLSSISGVEFFDPSDSSFRNLSVEQYVMNDLKYLDWCDVVLAYAELENPLCLGLNAEIGYAKAKNKYIILIDEKDKDPIYSRAFNFTRKLANVVCFSLEDGLKVVEDIYITKHYL